MREEGPKARVTSGHVSSPVHWPSLGPHPSRAPGRPGGGAGDALHHAVGLSQGLATSHRLVLRRGMTGVCAPVSTAYARRGCWTQRRASAGATDPTEAPGLPTWPGEGHRSGGGRGGPVPGEQVQVPLVEQTCSLLVHSTHDGCECSRAPEYQARGEGGQSRMRRHLWLLSCPGQGTAPGPR